MKTTDYNNPLVVEVKYNPQHGYDAIHTIHSNGKQTTHTIPCLELKY